MKFIIRDKSQEFSRSLVPNNSIRNKWDLKNTLLVPKTVIRHEFRRLSVALVPNNLK